MKRNRCVRSEPCPHGGEFDIRGHTVRNIHRRSMPRLRYTFLQVSKVGYHRGNLVRRHASHRESRIPFGQDLSVLVQDCSKVDHVVATKIKRPQDLQSVMRSPRGA